jgi:hypothetical protein
VVWTVFLYVSRRARRVAAAFLGLALVHVLLAGLAPHEASATPTVTVVQLDVAR